MEDFTFSGSLGIRMMKTASIMKRCVKDKFFNSFVYESSYDSHETHSYISENKMVTLICFCLFHHSVQSLGNFLVKIDILVCLTLKRESHLAAEATSWTCTTLRMQACLKMHQHHWWFLSTVVRGAPGNDPLTVCWPGRWPKN